MEKTFALAPMSTLFRVLTAVAFVVPVAFLIIMLAVHEGFVAFVALLVILYAWVWLRFRPQRFVVQRNVIRVEWPLKRREIHRRNITSVRLLSRAEAWQEMGFSVRIGAGGLWGGFGWLWTQRRGIVQMYVSRLDNLIWIERREARPWLITPERPDEFVKVLNAER